MAKQDHIPVEVPVVEESPRAAAIVPPTLLSLEARIDELEARLEVFESLEPVRGDSAVFQADRVARQTERAQRRAARERSA
jgi:hypothetical protein